MIRAMTVRVAIQEADFDVSTELAKLRAGDGRVGSVCSFVGTVREMNEGDSVSELALEHYEGMTSIALEAMIDKAFERFDIYDARIIHRIGALKPLDQIVLVAVTAAHRREAFQACEFLMDYLKTDAPFWKKELTPNASEPSRWLDARESDAVAVKRWML